MSIAVYDLTFTDGKSATALDMHGEPPDVAMAGIVGIFHAGYVATITPRQPACASGKNPTDCNPK